MKVLLDWALLFGPLYLAYYHFWGRHKERPKKKRPETAKERIQRARNRQRNNYDS
jgi:hypothetical protein